jgi:hypothetical protein
MNIKGRRKLRIKTIQKTKLTDKKNPVQSRETRKQGLGV